MITLLGSVALFLLAVVVVSLGWLHFQPTGLSPVRNAVSQYGITRFRAGYRVATIAFGVSALALAAGIYRAVPRGGRALVAALLLAFAAARCLISWFPMDTPGQARTQSGQRHGLLAFVAFPSVTIAAFRLGSVLSNEQRWHSLATISTALGFAMLVCLVGLSVARSAPPVRAVFGAVERGFYVSVIAWFAVFSLACALRP